MPVIINISGRTFAGLRAPEWGDTVSTDTRTKFRRNMGGKLLAANPSVIPVDRFQFTVDALSKTDVDNMLTFFAGTRGQKITLHDYIAGIWTGFIVDNPVTEQTGQGCQYKLSFSIEGSYSPP